MGVIPELTVSEAVKRTTPGDIALVHGRDPSWLSRAISIGQSLSTESSSYWRHAMRISAKPGYAYSQEWKFRESLLANYTGSIIKIYSNSSYDSSQRLKLCQSAEANLGSPYDLPGLLGQLFRAVPLVGGWLKDAIEIPWLTYCSERVCLTERTVTLDFCGGGSCQVSPTDIDAWCSANGWESYMLKLVA